MSNYFNEAGEPLMDAAAMRYEMYLDSMNEPDAFDGMYAAEIDLCPDCDEYIDAHSECGCPEYDDSYDGVAEDAMMEYGLFGDC